MQEGLVEGVMQEVVQKRLVEGLVQDLEVVVQEAEGVAQEEVEVVVQEQEGLVLHQALGVEAGVEEGVAMVTVMGEEVGVLCRLQKLPTVMLMGRMIAMGILQLMTEYQPAMKNLWREEGEKEEEMHIHHTHGRKFIQCKCTGKVWHHH